MDALSHALDRRDLMLDLARSPAPADRDRLMLALVNLCERNQGGGPETQALVRDVFLSLVDRVERDIRLRLVEKLAHAAWAPRELVLALAHQDIDIAAPLIAASPVLQDHDLVRLMVETAVEHQVEIARRPNLGAPVVQAILDQASPDVLTALAGNASADIGPFAMERLVSLSQTLAGLRAPLARHPRLSLDLGAMLYAWVGETLRRTLAERFAVDGAAFDSAVAAVVSEARGAPGDGVSLEADERAAMDRRVVEKLKAGGQLRPGLLLRALRDGKLTLFTIALAELGGFTTDEVRTAMDADTPELLFLACSAVGVDKGALPSILALLKPLNRGLPGAELGRGRLDSLITLLDRDSAARAFRKRLGSV
jgi:uncharacterized protein (DUF2336 family)